MVVPAGLLVCLIVKDLTTPRRFTAGTFGYRPTSPDQSEGSQPRIGNSERRRLNISRYARRIKSYGGSARQYLR